ncbi:hypothetical protein OS493_013104 [Desmophyllum pertusum]|uniref:Uncharacterized protein n=1 Tax=Desmophyllum pertusum TaxID=174260 RepID=A0A9X0CLE0_9CNID|nr:hypothetical protein OS493_013104 [Desmophyllum pertusum]
MTLHIIGRSICLVPDFPEELRSFILFWTFIQRSLKIYIWNYGFVGDVDKFDFRAIVAELVCPWTLGTKSDVRHLVAVTSHPTTNELLVLNSDSELSYFKLQDSNPVLTSLVKLHVDSSFHNDNISLFFALVLWLDFCGSRVLLRFMIFTVELKSASLKTYRDKMFTCGKVFTWLIRLDFGRSVEFGSFNLEQFLKFLNASNLPLNPQTLETRFPQ